MNIILNNGVSMPVIGFGTAGINGWNNNGPEVIKTIEYALQCGYRHFDTAPVYGNETSIGQAIKNSGIERESLFLTSKVSIDDTGYQQTLRAFDRSRENLGLDYIDSYLVHWPVAGRNEETWRALEHLNNEGDTRCIGVSNFEMTDLEQLANYANTLPVCNQIELHPYNNQQMIRDCCRKRGIKVVSWSPLGAAQWRDIPNDQRPFNDPVINNLAQKHLITRSQVILRWHLQHELISIPKSDRFEHIQNNIDIFGFDLPESDIHSIDRLNQDVRFGVKPG